MALLSEIEALEQQVEDAKLALENAQKTTEMLKELPSNGGRLSIWATPDSIKLIRTTSKPTKYADVIFDSKDITNEELLDFGRFVKRWLDWQALQADNFDADAPPSSDP